jgi:hypothetical protein
MSKMKWALKDKSCTIENHPLNNAFLANTQKCAMRSQIFYTCSVATSLDPSGP